MQATIEQQWASSPREVTPAAMHNFGPPPRPGADLRKSFHADPEAGQQMGFRTAVAWGMLSNAYLESLMIEVFGMNALESGDLNVTFLKPVYLGDTITARAKVLSIEETVDLRQRLTLSAWCENQDGTHVTDGYATVVI